MMSAAKRSWEGASRCSVTTDSCSARAHVMRVILTVFLYEDQACQVTCLPHFVGALLTGAFISSTCHFRAI